jgi:hypothetical protein
MEAQEFPYEALSILWTGAEEGGAMAEAAQDTLGGPSELYSSYPKCRLPFDP